MDAALVPWQWWGTLVVLLFAAWVTGMVVEWWKQRRSR